MGRPLKIKKYNGGIPVDQGFPNDQTTDNGYDGDNPGIVGGIDEDSEQLQCRASILVKGLGTIDAATNTTTVSGTGTHFTTDALSSSSKIYINDGSGGYTSIGEWDSTTDDVGIELTANASSNLTNSSWFYTAYGYSSVVRQKGSKKFLVAGTNSTIQDESIATGQAYMISLPGNTDWEALGAGPDAGNLKIFTATADGTGLGTTGQVWPLGVCTLVNDGTPTDSPNIMSVEIYDNGNTYYASRIKNHFTIDFTDNGTDENPGVEYIATFFDDAGNVDPATNKTITGTENWC